MYMDDCGYMRNIFVTYTVESTQNTQIYTVRKSTKEKRKKNKTKQT